MFEETKRLFIIIITIIYI